MSLFTFGKLEVEVDFTDADFIDRVERANNGLAEGAAQIPKSGKQQDRIRKTNAIYDRFFDDILGKGASAKMFSTASMLERVKAFGALKDLQNEQTLEITNIASKYIPNKTVKMPQDHRRSNKYRK